MIRKCHFISHHQYTKATRDIILLCNGLWSIRKYISTYTFNCFIWKDEYADEAFTLYKNFIQKLAKTNTIEIEILNN